MKKKSSFLFLLLFIVFPLFAIDIIEKTPELVRKRIRLDFVPSDWDVIRYPRNGMYSWNMLSNLAGNDIIYISPSRYIDLETLNTVLYCESEPESFLFPMRPPYSNNNMPYRTHDGDIRSINIETNETVTIPYEAYFHFDDDSDRVHTSDRINTPEYSVAVQSNYYLYYFSKEHQQIPFCSWGDHPGNYVVIEILLKDFKGTAFDNSYWLETFDNLLSSLSIITKFDISLNEQQIKGNNGIVFSKNYLVERIMHYFNMDLDNKVLLDDMRINIYDKGFYAYNPNKIILFDIVNRTVVSYNIESYDFPQQDFEDEYYRIFVKNNHFYILFGYNNIIGIYKLIYGGAWHLSREPQSGGRDCWLP